MTNKAGFADHILSTPLWTSEKARETSEPFRDGFWLTHRRDGRSDRWMIAWYDPTMRTFRLRSTRTSDRAKAEKILAHFEATTDILPGRRYDAPHVPLKVYFIGGDVGAIKIGTAVDVERRCKSLQCGSPIILRVLACVSGGLDLERSYHAQFAEHRLHGEWFERSPSIESEIERLGGGR